MQIADRSYENACSCQYSIHQLREYPEKRKTEITSSKRFEIRSFCDDDLLHIGFSSSNVSNPQSDTLLSPSLTPSHSAVFPLTSQFQHFLSVNPYLQRELLQRFNPSMAHKQLLLFSVSFSNKSLFHMDAFEWKHQKELLRKGMVFAWSEGFRHSNEAASLR